MRLLMIVNPLRDHEYRVLCEIVELFSLLIFFSLVAILVVVTLVLAVFF